MIVMVLVILFFASKLLDIGIEEMRKDMTRVQCSDVCVVCVTTDQHHSDVCVVSVTTD